MQGYQRQHGLEQAAGVDFSAAQWQAFYHESFVTGKVSDPERTPRRMSATIEYANNFDFGNEAGEARRAQGADQSELDEDRECAYDSSKLGKKVRLAKMLRNKHDGMSLDVSRISFVSDICLGVVSTNQEFFCNICLFFSSLFLVDFYRVSSDEQGAERQGTVELQQLH